MRDTIRRGLRCGLEALWPTRCPICGEESEDDRTWVTDEGRRPLLHTGCLAELPRTELRLDPVAPHPRAVRVRWCFEDCPAFFRILHGVKYEGQWPLLSALIREFVPWARRICGSAEGVVWVPIPDDPRRQRARGGSVVDALLDGLSALEGTSRGERLLVRRRHAPPQARIDDPARRATNVRTLFGVGDLTRVAPSARLVLVDDQITTGATAREAVVRLRMRGHSVQVLALAGARRAPEWLDP